MSKYLYAIILASLFLNAEMAGQSDNFIVNPAPFSTRLYDEFSPVFYKGGIVYCSNLNDNSLVSYKDEKSRLFKIFYVTKRGNSAWNRPRILAKELTTAFNDGPATFNETGNMIYYSRNNSIENSLRNISDTSNKLGIYSAELINGIWGNIKPFKFNNQHYSLCTPSLAPDGERIFFSSDMPGGYGGMDLYYCDRRDSDWGQPVNLGPAINTQKSESFPFISNSGKLYFASDGHNGFGGKDLFYTREINNKWINPVHLDSAINSEADDFGLVIDSTYENGYFSTNRRKSDDIFSFSSAPVEFSNCDSIKENNYCFTFYDEKQRLIDTVAVIYKWDFGNGIIRIGKEVKHCFPGPGKYPVRLTILDELTGDTIANQADYKAELENNNQAYINSYNIGVEDKSISFEGITTDLKGFRITDYYWNIGDGFKPGGPIMKTTFKKKGDYKVQLGLLGAKDSLGVIPKTCVMKKIRISENYQELAQKGTAEKDVVKEKADSVLNYGKTMNIRIYFTDDLSERQKTKIKSYLREPGIMNIRFDNYGIDSASYQVLDIFAGALKENPDIRLEMVINAAGNETPGNLMGISEKRAREIAFYFKNKELNNDSFSSKGFDMSDKVFKPFIPDDKSKEGKIEFIFMKR
jgi:outer membrane protein OmpA-like peptidoglycan-associated protein